MHKRRKRASYLRSLGIRIHPRSLVLGLSHHIRILHTESRHQPRRNVTWPLISFSPLLEDVFNLREHGSASHCCKICVRNIEAPKRPPPGFREHRVSLHGRECSGMHSEFESERNGSG